MAESHFGEWLLQSLYFFKHSVEFSKLVKGEKLLITRSNFELILFTNFFPTLACATPSSPSSR
jgi:hypothetical protein